MKALHPVLNVVEKAPRPNDLIHEFSLSRLTISYISYVELGAVKDTQRFKVKTFQERCSSYILIPQIAYFIVHAIRRGESLKASRRRWIELISNRANEGC